jgi:hypothetical protein
VHCCCIAVPYKAVDDVDVAADDELQAARDAAAAALSASSASVLADVQARRGLRYGDLTMASHSL